jgi:uncharacterized membrane protein
MNYELSEWLNLIVRWFHVFAGILWIGQTFLFTWMDRTLDREESLWLVHSGGFYIVERQGFQRICRRLCIGFAGKLL